MGLSISISVPKLKLFQRKKVTLQMHESAAVDPPTVTPHPKHGHFVFGLKENPGLAVVGAAFSG